MLTLLQHLPQCLLWWLQPRSRYPSHPSTVHSTLLWCSTPNLASSLAFSIATFASC